MVLPVAAIHFQKVELSSTSCNIVKQKKNCEKTHVTLCNSPATCLAMALQENLLRKLHSVRGPSSLQLHLHSLVQSQWIFAYLLHIDGNW